MLCWYIEFRSLYNRLASTVLNYCHSRRMPSPFYSMGINEWGYLVYLESESQHLEHSQSVLHHEKHLDRHLAQCELLRYQRQWCHFWICCRLLVCWFWACLNKKKKLNLSKWLEMWLKLSIGWNFFLGKNQKNDLAIKNVGKRKLLTLLRIGRLHIAPWKQKKVDENYNCQSTLDIFAIQSVFIS